MLVLCRAASSAAAASAAAAASSTNSLRRGISSCRPRTARVLGSNNARPGQRNLKHRLAQPAQIGACRTLFWSNAQEAEPLAAIPATIRPPSYAQTGQVEPCRDICLHSNADDIAALREAASIAARALEYAEGLVKVGALTQDIDDAIREFIVANGAYPAPLNYAGFPKSSCISVNEVVCHGIPGGMPDGLGREVADGDVVSIDVSVYTAAGFFGDNCRTYIAGVGSEEDVSLVEHTRRAMWAGIRACRPGVPLSDVGNAIANYCDSHGLASVERFCGHGIGRAMHMQPMVMHFRNNDTFPLQPGMTFTVEPMITRGKQDCSILEDGT
eukprot:INCI7090.1.p1 GENE.INCI7090.1~~INCI7090.1.p1  ORF type:complete len:328 (-),score=49.72 INCI7090.1:294-1277(-)